MQLFILRCELHVGPLGMGIKLSVKVVYAIVSCQELEYQATVFNSCIPSLCISFISELMWSWF